MSTFKAGGVTLPSSVLTGGLVLLLSLVLGDLNARVGTPQLRDANDQPYNYEGIRDHRVNAHGREVLNMCAQNGLAVVNHLRYGQGVFNSDRLMSNMAKTIC